MLGDRCYNEPTFLIDLGILGMANKPLKKLFSRLNSTGLSEIFINCLWLVSVKCNDLFF
jgi:hypothetical protein